MALTLDFGKAWRLIVDPITVTLRLEGQAGQSVPYVLKRDATLEDFAQEPAILEQTTTVFHLWADWLAGTVPVKGYEVVMADGSVWHVDRVQTHNRGRRFRLSCILERAAP